MPVYIHLSNLIVLKSAVERKYPGGLAVFRSDYGIGEDIYWQEDRELFSITSMNSDEHDIAELVRRGLHYDYENHRSDDFVILPRYSDFLWSVPWAKHNGVFAWHTEADKTSVAKAKEISNTNMDELSERFDRGDNPFLAIW